MQLYLDASGALFAPVYHMHPFGKCCTPGSGKVDTCNIADVMFNLLASPWRLHTALVMLSLIITA